MARSAGAFTSVRRRLPPARKGPLLPGPPDSWDSISTAAFCPAASPAPVAAVRSAAQVLCLDTVLTVLAAHRATRWWSFRVVSIGAFVGLVEPIPMGDSFLYKTLEGDFEQVDLVEALLSGDFDESSQLVKAVEDVNSQGIT